MNRHFLLALWLLVPQFTGAATYSSATAGQSGLVLLANRNVPEGVELARYYAAQRGVPAERILILDLPTGETLSRGDYEQRLRDPLLIALRELKLIEQVRRDKSRVVEHDSGWSTVHSSLRYLVPMYGVPLRIDDTKPWPLEKLANLANHGLQRDEAAVDSELCLLLQESFDLRGRVFNPYYNQLRWDGAASAPLLLVSRLDGPDPATVRRMIDGALQAERNGLHGRVYIDQRAFHEDDYQVGDVWLEEAAQRLVREGYDVTMERTDAVFGELYPMDNAALYLGWYVDQATGPFLRTNFNFRAGALAYHNHSGNARVLRTGSNYWTGPLLARGAAVSMGAVAEPFLGFTPHLSILVDRLCRGLPWADSLYLSMTVLSWQTTVLGDPLYRPFAVPLDEQVKRMEAAGDVEVDWAYLRRINLLVREGRLNVALRYARERVRLRDSPLLREKLADLFVLNELPDEAVLQFELALKQATSGEMAVRVGARYLNLLLAQGRHEQALKVNQALRERWSGDRFLGALPLVKP